ncbi:diguanylate cyclase domain-containing protein [Mycolicibacterium sp. CBM1]
MGRLAAGEREEARRRQMLITYGLFFSGVYWLAVVSSIGDTVETDMRGEIAAAVLGGVGFLLCLRTPLRGWRYVSALACVSAAPVIVLFFHLNPTAQVWSLIPLMFLGIFVRTWHSAVVTRTYVVAIGIAATVGLLVAPAPVPPLWPLLFVLSIGGAAEVFGVSHAILRDAADRDPLTGVRNRTGFDLRVDELMSVAHRKRRPLAVLLLDVDDFKLINDSDGHAAGDQVLVALTTRWKAKLPRDAVIGRLGGDEFAVVLSLRDDGEAGRLAEILADVSPVRVTVGLAVGTPTEATDFTALLATADADLYRRKRERKAPSADLETA